MHADLATVSRRRRPHPARRARRAVGVSALGAYAGLMATIGWAQRSAEAETPTPEPTPGSSATNAGIERLDLSGAAILRQPATPHGQATPSSAPAVAPTPPPPPSLAATTTTSRVSAPPTTTRPTPTPSGPAPTAAPATTTTAAAPPTTTSIAPPTTPPPTTIPTGGS
ncbi:MAG: hypothetical protein R2707_05690 [Acidimicrobiales bacterium]